jgi:hypothetical protein
VKRAIVLLLVLFAGQVALTASLYWKDSGPEIMESTPLIQFDTQAIDEIHIEDSSGNETILVRDTRGWVIPELGSLPADWKKTQTLLDVVSSKTHGTPVADTVAARQRFRVASYHYRRRLSFISNGELRETIYLGTSPGFRRVHARNDTTDEIYSIPFNTFDAPGEQNEWLDRSILQVAKPDLIAGPGFQLVRDGDSWVNQNGGLPEARELEALLIALASIQIDGVANEDDQRSVTELEPDLTLQLAVAQRQIKLEFFSLGDGRYVLSNEYPVFFSLAAYDYERILGLDPLLLLGTNAPGRKPVINPAINTDANAGVTTREQPR